LFEVVEMLMKLYENTDLSQNFETNWLLVDFSGRKPNVKARSLSVLWENVEGEMKGQLELFASSDGKMQSIGAAIPISTNSNTQDASVFLFVTSVRYIKFRYSSNGTTSGKIEIFLEIQP